MSVDLIQNKKKNVTQREQWWRDRNRFGDSCTCSACSVSFEKVAFVPLSFPFHYIGAKLKEHIEGMALSTPRLLWELLQWSWNGAHALRFMWYGPFWQCLTAKCYGTHLHRWNNHCIVWHLQGIWCWSSMALILCPQMYVNSESHLKGVDW